MSEVKPENDPVEDIDAKIREIGDPLIVNYLAKFKPEDGKKAASGSHIVAAIELLHSKLDGEQIPDGRILDHPFMKSLVKDGDEEFSGDELVVKAVEAGIDVPGTLKSDKVNDTLNKSNEPSADKKTFAKNGSDSSNKPSPAAENAAEQLAKEQLDANPDYKKKQRKQLEERLGRPVSDEELLAAEKGKVLKNILAAEKEVSQERNDMHDQPVPQGALQAIGSGIGGLFRGLKEGAKNSAKAMDNWARYERPAKKIMTKEAEKAIKAVDKKMESTKSALDRIASNTDVQGNVLSSKDKKSLQADALKNISELKERFGEFTELADNPVLPKKERKKLYEKAEDLGKFAEDLKMHPEGNSKADKEFKQQLNEQAKAISKMVKDIINTIKSFFQKKGPEQKIDASPEMSM